VRDDLRGSLKDLSESLNSEIDELSRLLEQYKKEPTEAGAQKLAMSIGVLHATWPVRQAKIENAVRKVLSDAGFYIVPKQHISIPTD